MFLGLLASLVNFEDYFKGQNLRYVAVMVFGKTVIAHFDFGLIRQMLSCLFRNFLSFLRLAINRKITGLALSLIIVLPMRRLDCH